MTDYPRIFRVRQHFDTPRVDDVAAEVNNQLAARGLDATVKPGERVAITAGSRGIANIEVIIKAAVGFFKGLGAEPFIVPAMGSHGGGTAEGQQKVIESYGVTEAFCGCPILASMETVEVCQTEQGFPVHFDRHAFEADHVLVCNRIKPHTNFVGDIESGLMKMMLIGLGKHAGAILYHQAIIKYSFGQIVRSVAREVIEKCRIVAGLAIVENCEDETAKIEVVAPGDFESREKELLVLAKQWMPRLPFTDADVLVIDEMGKNIAGTGMDTNVIGRKYSESHSTDKDLAQICRIVVRGLTAQTHGNAAGVGIADFCKTSLVDQMDKEATWVNCLTAVHPSGGRIPIHYPTDREILDRVLPTIGLTPPADARLQWIRNTLDLVEVECSEAYLQEAESREDLEVLSELRELPLDDEGNLSSCHVTS